MKKNLILFALLLLGGYGFAQTSDDQYRKPLKEVLDEVQTRFHVSVRCPDELLKDQWVTNAEWRFRLDAETSLTNILTPLDLKWMKEKNKKYKIKRYEYYRWSVEDGQAKLDSLSRMYNDIASWEKRKKEIRPCLFEALGLSPLPPRPSSKPMLSNFRKMDGYTIENIALETLPGFYVCGSIYRPAKINKKAPAMLCANGHWADARYNKDHQTQFAQLARLGVIAVSYDLFAWGESRLQFADSLHRKSLSHTVQTLNSLRLLDYLCSLKEVDTSRIGIVGGSGGGSQTVLVAALDERIKMSIPVASLSCYFYGGCPCESGMPIHFCGGSTDNPEIAAMIAPRPMLVISDGGDWSDHVPQIEYPYLQRIWGFYGKTDKVQNVHLPNDRHDFGASKRNPMLKFVAKQFGLDINVLKDKNGNIDDSKVTIEEYSAMYSFGKNGELLPANAIRKFEDLEKLFK
jgi:hypothetical protein